MSFAQHTKAKNENPSCTIFVKEGDFYETYDKDAPVVAKILNLTVTTRTRQAEPPVKMCGFPYWQFTQNMTKLEASGITEILVFHNEKPKK